MMEAKHFEADTADREALKVLVRERAFLFGDFTLTSGRKSKFYLDCKQITLHPESAYLFARIIIRKLKEHNINAFGGLTLGADPTVGAVAAVAHLDGMPDLKLFIVRKEPKKHGTRQYIEGPTLLPTDRVAIVDDVITTGGSILKAVDQVEALGCTVVRAIALVDRHEGGRAALEARGLEVDPVFEIGDLIEE
jgi:orotate phosphoribosyltransferase